MGNQDREKCGVTCSHKYTHAHKVGNSRFTCFKKRSITCIQHRCAIEIHCSFHGHACVAYKMRQKIVL